MPSGHSLPQPLLGPERNSTGPPLACPESEVERTRIEAGMVGWSREKLAEKAGVAEFRGSNPKLGTVNKWRRALEAAGVEFIDSDAKSFEGGPAGVRLRNTKKR